MQYGLYAISNFIWTISLYLSNATGYLIQQAYTLDFISDTANQIGENMQILAGVSSNGFSQSGFYVGFLLLFILIIGAYVGYVGLIKRETSKVIQAVTNFVVVFYCPQDLSLMHLLIFKSSMIFRPILVNPV